MQSRKSPKRKTSFVPFLVQWTILFLGILLITLIVSRHSINSPEILLTSTQPVAVTIQNNRLSVGGQPFEIKGINYNQISTGSDQPDVVAPRYDVPKIAALGANTIGTYSLGAFEWDQWSNITTHETLYNNLYPIAEQYNLKIIVGYFSNSHMDWTDATRVNLVTTQYQNLILKAKDRPSTLLYMIGNEVFEKMSADTQRLAYAKWIGQMTEWTHQTDPNHPVMYADNAAYTAIPWLKTYAPSLDIYGANNYEWQTTFDLESKLKTIATQWPNKPIMLHEWGCDSFNVATWKENEDSQSTKIKDLATAIKNVYTTTTNPFLGSLLFEYSDEWSKVGSISTQDPDQGWPWVCSTCFDGKANEDYWGLARASTSGQSASRMFKTAYTGLQQVWAGTGVITPTQTPTPLPTSSPSSLDTTAPTVKIISPLSNSLLLSKVQVTVSALDNTKISKVELYLDGVLKTTDISAPYAASWNTKNLSKGTHVIKAIASDSSGNKTSAEVSVLR